MLVVWLLYNNCSAVVHVIDIITRITGIVILYERHFDFLLPFDGATGVAVIITVIGSNVSYS